jgi:hypothetical protein
MATKKPAMTKIFKGKETKAEEMKEAKAVKSGKISVAQYVKGEKSEGPGEGKGAKAKGMALKSGKLSAKAYASPAKKMKK